MTAGPSDELFFATFEFTAGDRPPSDFSVVSIQGRERLSQPYAFDVVVATESAAATADTLLGRMARLSMRGADPRPRHVAGLLTRVVAEAAIGATTFLRVRLAPRLWLLGRRKSSRVFQGQTVQDIVSTVLREVDVEMEWRTTRALTPREYCVQYQESDFDFVTRLLAEEGIFYWFKHPKPGREDASPARDEREVVVFADDALHHDPIAGKAELPVRAGGALAHVGEGGEFVRRFALTHDMREARATVRGFDLLRPAFRPEDTKQAKVVGFEAAPLGAYDHDRVLDEATVRDPVASLRLDELRAKALVGEGVTVSRRLAPGATFKLVEHAVEEVNGTYVVTHVDHKGKQPQGRLGIAVGPDELYTATFKCAPAGVAFRPRRRPRKLMQVTETATVVGPPGEEIHVDELGRVKVQFHWDREGQYDDKSSCWIRCIQPWAGRAWGTQFIPRVGMEVAVTFTGGDTDRPMILGALYNGVTPTPYPLPAEKTRSGIKTRSTPGGRGSNELRFEDAAEKEQIYLHAERDLDEVVEHDHTRHVKGTEQIQIDEARVLEVAQDNVRIVHGSDISIVQKHMVLQVVGNQHVMVGTPDVNKLVDEPNPPLPEDFQRRLAQLAAEALLEDPQVAILGKARRAKMWWAAEQLEGDDYRAAKYLVGKADRAGDEAAALDGETTRLTEQLDGLRGRADAEPAAVGAEIAAMRPKIAALDEKVTEAQTRIAKVVVQNKETVAPIAEVQRLTVARLESSHAALDETRGRLARARDLTATFATLRSGRGAGGGGMAGDPAFKSGQQIDFFGKEKGATAEKLKGSLLEVHAVGGIVADSAFTISVGNGASSIVLKPDGITLHSAGPINISSDTEVNVNGASKVNINC